MTIKTLLPIINKLKKDKDKYQTGSKFCCSLAMKHGKIIAIAFNCYYKFHPYYKFGVYKSLRGNNKDWIASLHSEICLLKKLGQRDDFNKITIVNIRIDNNKKVALACPCINCRKVLQRYDFKKIVYTIDENELGILSF